MIYCCEAYLPITGNPYLYGGTFEADDLVKMMDDAGVKGFMTLAQGYDGSNNYTVKKAMDKFPDRIYGCYVPGTRGQEAVDEFRMTVREWGFKCLKLTPSPTTEDLAEAAADLDIPILIHTGGESWTEQSKQFYSRIDALAKKYPYLPIILEHMGYRYAVDLALEVTGKNPNVHLGTTIVSAAEPIVVKKAVQDLGAEKVLFGSNAPWALPYYGVEGIRRVKLAPEDEKLVLGGNFKRIFRLGT